MRNTRKIKGESSVPLDLTLRGTDRSMIYLVRSSNLSIPHFLKMPKVLRCFLSIPSLIFKRLRRIVKLRTPHQLNLYMSSWNRTSGCLMACYTEVSTWARASSPRMMKKTLIQNLTDLTILQDLQRLRQQDTHMVTKEEEFNWEITTQTLFSMASAVTRTSSTQKFTCLRSTTDA